MNSNTPIDNHLDKDKEEFLESLATELDLNMLQTMWLESKVKEYTQPKLEAFAGEYERGRCDGAFNILNDVITYADKSTYETLNRKKLVQFCKNKREALKAIKEKAGIE